MHHCDDRFLLRHPDQGGGPDWGEFGKGLVSFQVPEGSLATALAFISTNAAVTSGIYASYLGKEKK